MVVWLNTDTRKTTVSAAGAYRTHQNMAAANGRFSLCSNEKCPPCGEGFL